MDGRTSLEILQAHHTLLSSKFVKMILESETAEQRAEVRKNMLLASENLAEARLLIFNENDPAVTQLLTQLESIEVQLMESLNKFKKVEQVLGIMTAAVGLGQSLVALGRGEGS